MSKIKTPFKNNRPSRHWRENFMKRNPHLSFRKSQHLHIDRASVSEEVLRKWYAETKEHLYNLNLLDIHPSRIFNADETSLPLCPGTGKVLAEKGAATVYTIQQNSDRENVTVLCMYNAEGSRAPPMIMYPYKTNLPEKIITSAPDGVGLGLSDNGWMTTESFFEYIVNVFYKWLISKCIKFPIVLYLDGHSSHLTIPLVDFCVSHGIEIILFYPHCTHICQPCDIAFFHPLKVWWSPFLIQWKSDNDVPKIKREHLASIVLEALNSMPNESQIIINGFKAAGLVPFDPDIVDFNMLVKKKKKINPIENEDVGPAVDQAECVLKLYEDSLKPELLSLFKKAEASGIWTGDIIYQGMFEHWQELRLSGKSMF